MLVHRELGRGPWEQLNPQPWASGRDLKVGLTWALGKRATGRVSTAAGPQPDVPQMLQDAASQGCLSRGGRASSPSSREWQQILLLGLPHPPDHPAGTCQSEVRVLPGHNCARETLGKSW